LCSPSARIVAAAVMVLLTLATLVRAHTLA
jgi:hypothetical protein